MVFMRGRRVREMKMFTLDSGYILSLKNKNDKSFDFVWEQNPPQGRNEIWARTSSSKVGLV